MPIFHRQKQSLTTHGYRVLVIAIHSTLVIAIPAFRREKQSPTRYRFRLHPHFVHFAKLEMTNAVWFEIASLGQNRYIAFVEVTGLTFNLRWFGLL